MAVFRPGCRCARPGGGLSAREQSLPCSSNARQYPLLAGASRHARQDPLERGSLGVRTTAAHRAAVRTRGRREPDRNKMDVERAGCDAVGGRGRRGPRWGGLTDGPDAARQGGVPAGRGRLPPTRAGSGRTAGGRTVSVLALRVLRSADWGGQSPCPQLWAKKGTGLAQRLALGRTRCGPHLRAGVDRALPVCKVP